MAERVKSSGIVYLVGAGPGHPGLITRLGYDLLQNCDAVAYDALIPMELIAGLPCAVEKHYVGKRAGRHSLPQSKINELLVSLAKRGLKVVRLKGGDPFIFGRSGEEADYLASAGIPVVMVPGVTAASAAAAMSGFSLTNRHAASWIFVATGHGAESESIPVPWDQVAALPGGTLVIYMGLAKLDHLVARLLSSGLPPETPAMVVQAASTGIQKSVEAPLTGLTRECKRRGLKPPALIIVGEAVGCRATGTGAGSAVLAGKRILITGPSRTSSRFCNLLRKEGAEPIPLPTVVRKPVRDAEAWPAFLNTLECGGVCLFAGDYEVDCFFAELLSRGLDARKLNRLKIVAQGRSAESALLQHGIKADRSIEPADSADLENAVSGPDSNQSAPLIWVAGSCRDPRVESRLRRLCGDVTPLTVCTESTARWEAHWAHELIENPPEFVVFTSTAEVFGFFELLGDDMARHLASKTCLAAADDSVAEALQRQKLTVEVKAGVSGVDALVCALIAHSQEQASETVVSHVC